MKKTMKQYSFASRLKSLALVFGIALAFASCANEDIAQNPNGTDNNRNFTIFSTGDPATRTSMESNGAFYWEAGDKIWVKDDNGTWRQSRNAPTEKTASFKFEVPGKFTKTTTYKVYYPGQNGNQNQVTIAANQSQASLTPLLILVHQVIAEWQMPHGQTQRMDLLSRSTTRQLTFFSCHVPAIQFCIIVT